MHKIINGILTVALLSGCATVVNGTHQSIGISSNPSDAHVWVDQYYVGHTPIIVGLTRSSNHFLHIEIEGFEPYEAVFTRTMSGWVFGNILCGGFIGIAVDVISGSIYRLTPDQVQAEMHLSQSAFQNQTTDSYVAVVLKPKPEWMKVDILEAKIGKLDK